MNESINATPDTPVETASGTAPGAAGNAPSNGQSANFYNGQPNPVFNVPPMPQAFGAPVVQRKTNKGLAKYIFLTIITLGIYAIVVMSSVSEDINIVASRYDGKKTMHFCLLFFLVGPLTLGIGYLVWYSNISSRIGDELKRRMIPYSFGSSDYWLWCVLGSLIIVGPFIYYHKLFTATNMMCEHYNING